MHWWRSLTSEANLIALAAVHKKASHVKHRERAPRGFDLSCDRFDRTLIRDERHLPALEWRRHVALIPLITVFAAAEWRPASTIITARSVRTRPAVDGSAFAALTPRRSLPITPGRRTAFALSGRRSAELRSWPAAFRPRSAIVTVKAPAAIAARSAAGTRTIIPFSPRWTAGRAAPNDFTA